ncbi:periplasmic binding protein-like I [Polychytrium aggregatum]|uniref:periplasmic binding protein-like I n=1 Tax=Polychytrium aggregatum TaxID=110093 RepID=UPI0022FDB0F4|nr:periplasmic binding protein-like I [Polychytrium aggregatum]KAI9209143.1 periplasmic binding protein-like I [Polychytrium aggregatum]
MRSYDKTKYNLTVGFILSPWPNWMLLEYAYMAQLGAMIAVDHINNSSSLMRDATIHLVVQNASANWGKAAIAVNDLHEMGNLAMVIGDVVSPMNIHSAAVSSYYGIPHLCLSCGDASLSDPVHYSTFLRMVFMISILYTMDSMSLSSLNLALEAAVLYNMTILTTQAIQFAPSVNTSSGSAVMAALSPVYDILRNLETRIIVLIADSVLNDDIYFSAAAYGLAGPDYAWISFNPLGNLSNDTAIQKYGRQAFQSQYHNFIRASYSVESGESTTECLEYHSHDDYYIQNRLGAELPNDQREYLINYPYSSGSDAFDATMAVLLTWDRIVNETGFEANAIYNGSLTGQCTPQNISATHFDSNHNIITIGTLYGYTEFGDIVYGTYNQTSINLSMSSSGQYLINSLFYNGVIPSDMPTYIEDQLLYGDPVATFILVTHAVILTMIVVSMGIILVYRNKPLMKSKSPLLNAILMFGEVLVLVSGLIYMLEPSPWTCISQPWFLSLGHSAMHSGENVSNNKKLEAHLIPNLLLLSVTLGIASAMSILLVGWTFANPVSVTTVFTLQTEYAQCTFLSSPEVFWTSSGSLYAANGILFLATAIMARKAKSIPAHKGDSLNIEIALYNIVICSVLIIAQIYWNAAFMRIKAISRLVIQLIGIAVFHASTVVTTIMAFLTAQFGSPLDDIINLSISNLDQVGGDWPQAESTKSSDNPSQTFCWKREAGIFSRWVTVKISYIPAREPYLIFIEPNAMRPGVSAPLSLISIGPSNAEPSCFRISWLAESYLVETGDEELASQWIAMITSSIERMSVMSATPISQRT